MVDLSTYWIQKGSVIKVWYFILISKINAFSWYQLIIVIFHYNAKYLSTSLKIKKPNINMEIVPHTRWTCKQKLAAHSAVNSIAYE